MTSHDWQPRMQRSGAAIGAVILIGTAATGANAADLLIRDFSSPAVAVQYTATSPGSLVFQTIVPGTPPTFINAFSATDPSAGSVTATLGGGAVTLTSPADSFEYVQLGFGDAAGETVSIDATPYHYVKFSFNSATEAENLAYTIFSNDSNLTGHPYDINGINDVPAAGGEPFNAYIPIDAEAGFDYADVNGGLFQVIGGGDYSLASISLTSSAPEPAAWALMLVGVGGLGARLRSGRRHAVAV